MVAKTFSTILVGAVLTILLAVSSAQSKKKTLKVVSIIVSRIKVPIGRS